METRSQIMKIPNLRAFRYAELKAATGNFRSVIYGRMFKGWVDENSLAPSTVGTGKVVAVKRFDPGSIDDVEQWQSEELVGQLQSKITSRQQLPHPNLVKLLGYCIEKEERFLVYEFVANGSLPNHLFRKFFRKETLSWDNRLKIAIGAARALTFLHSSEIIYRDVKPTNILLDGNNNAKLSSCHFAISGPANGNLYRSASVRGTMGYIDPEYMITGNLSVKSDVYSFGVVLLQILTGLMACDYTRPQEQISLVDWAIPLLSHETKLQTIMDADMEDLYSSHEASETAKLALECLERDPQKRPSMIEVVERLEHILTNRTTQ